MTKTIENVTYELVSKVIPARVGVPEHVSCNCYDCCAVGNKDLCIAPGNECIGKGVWEVKT